MSSVGVSGYMQLNTDDADDLFETLIEQGILWEYLSILFEESVENKAYYLSKVGKAKSKADDSPKMDEILKLMSSMQSQLKTIETKVNTAPIVTTNSNVSTSSLTTAVEPVKATPKRQKKQVDTSKLGGGFASMAQGMNKFGKK